MNKQIEDLEEQYDKIYRYCYFKVRHRQLAEDITQETFLRFMESKGYRESGKGLRYLYTIARNLCMDEFRKSRYQELSGAVFEAMLNGESGSGFSAGRLGETDRDFSGSRVGEQHWEKREGRMVKPRDEMAETLDRMAVRAALDGLGEEDRELLLLRYANELPLSVIGKMFGISRFAVRRRLQRTAENLKRNLGKEGFE